MERLSSLWAWLGKGRKEAHRSPRRRKQPSCRLCLEQLEDRLAPATLAPGDIFVTESDPSDGLVAVVQINRTTGAQTIVSSNGQFVTPLGMALSATDSQGQLGDGFIFVADPDSAGGGFGPLGTILQVSLSTGGHGDIGDNRAGNNVVIDPMALALDANGDILFVDRNGSNPGHIGRIDLPQPTPHVLAPQSFVSQGGFLVDPSGLVLNGAGYIYVTDPGAQRIIGVNPIGGAQTSISSGGNLSNNNSITLGTDGMLYVTTYSGGIGKIVRVDPGTGVQTVITSGGNLNTPSAIAVDIDGTLLVTDPSFEPGGIIRVDPGTGAQSVLTNGSPLLQKPTGILVVPSTFPVAPTASAGGPYFVAPGGTVQLDASGTFDPNQANTTLTYAWDLDGDGIFGEVAGSRGNETGMTPTFSAAGLTAPDSVTVRLRVTDSTGRTSSASTTIAVSTDPAPSGANFSGFTLVGGAGNQGGTAGWTTEGTALSVAGDAVYVGGFVSGANGTDFANETSFVAKYNTNSISSTSGPDWSRTFVPGNRPWDIQATSEGVYTANENWGRTIDLAGGKEHKSLLAKLAPDGSAGTGAGGTQWMSRTNFFVYQGVEAFHAVTSGVVAGSTFIYAAGGGQPNSYGAYMLAKYDTSGNLLAKATDSSVGVSFDTFFLPPPGPPDGTPGGSDSKDIAFVNGNVYVVGATGWRAEGDHIGRGYIVKYDPNLNLQWRVRSTDLAVGAGFEKIIGLGGALFAVGAVNNNWGDGGIVGGPEDFLIQKYDENTGARLWTRVFGGSGKDHLTGVVAVNGRLFAVGQTSSEGSGGLDGVLLEIDPATGAVLSKTVFGGPQDDYFTDIDTDGTNLFVAGDTRSFASADGNAVGQMDVMLLRFSPASLVAGTDAPVADAGGPYTVGEGKSLTLAATGTTDPNQVNTTLTYAWDLDGDGVFGETGAGATRGNETGMTPTFVATSLDGPSTFTVSLRVTDSGGLTSTDTATINIANTPPTLTISGTGSACECAPYTLNLASSDPGFDTITGWTIYWGDGAVDTVAGNPSSVTHTYASGPASYTIFASATDEDGTYTANTHNVAVTADAARLGTATLLTIGSPPPDALGFYRFVLGLGSNGYVTAEVTAGAGDTRLSLFDINGALLIQSDGQSPTNLNDKIVQHLQAGTYYLKVDGRGGPLGPFTLTTSFAAAGAPFGPFAPIPVGDGPVAVASGDFNYDGLLDLAVANANSNDLSILSGNGDGTFQNAAMIGLGSSPSSVVAGDFNRDGRVDLAVALASNDIRVLLGNGDGTFQSGGLLAVGPAPKSLVARDFDRDGKLDLAVANSGSTTVSVLMGLGNGSFQAAVSYYTVGSAPVFLVSGEFNGDGQLDLAALNSGSNTVSVLRGNGNGTFQAKLDSATPASPVALATGDFDEDGWTDLAVANSGSANVSIRFGNSNGTFGATGEDQASFAVGAVPAFLVTGDFNGDKHVDLLTANASANNLSVVLGNGDGGILTAANQFPVGIGPVALATGDFNGDGKSDIAAANQASDNLSVLVGTGASSFITVSQISNPIQSTPLLADLTGDGVVDVSVLRKDGRILFRRGQAGNPGVFDAPVIVNPAPISGNLSLDFPARDLAVVVRNGQPALAALDARGSLSIYSYNGGTFQRTAGPAVPGLVPVRVASGDLNGDLRDDLVVSAAGSGQVFVYLQDVAGSFGIGPVFQLGVGTSPLAINLLDMNADARLDIVVTNQFSGDVSILVNNPGAFTEQRFRAGAGPYGQGKLIETNPSLGVRSEEGTVAVVAGLFDAGGTMDLIAINKGSDSASVLLGSGSGGVFNPQSSFALGANATVAVAAQFNGGTPGLEVAVLDEATKQIQVFSGSVGTFTQTALLDAGNAPTGISAADVNGDGALDLLVGNEFGDVLVILGNGDGTFRPFVRSGQNVPFVATDLNGDGAADVLLCNQSLDQALEQLRVAGTTSFTPGSFAEGRADGLIGPGAVTLADLNSDGLPDYLVANSGSNNVLVYLGTGPGQFSTTARSFFAGTNPVGMLVQDLNADTRLDLVVANQGSNDVSVLFGQGTGALWTLTPGPRLNVGAGPNNVALRDQTGDGIADLLVTNGQAGSISMLPGIGAGGVGTGFFSDNNPSILNVGAIIAQTIVPTLPGVDALLRTTTGSIFRFNPVNFTQAPQLAFAPALGRLVTSMTPAANGTLVAARSDSTLSLLTSDATGLFAESLIFNDARLDDPSALEVVGLEIYVTNAGDSVPLVIGLADGIPVLVSSFRGSQFEGSGQRGQFADIQPLDGAGFAFVATLLTGSGTDTGGEETGAAAGSSFIVGLGSRQVPLLGDNDILTLVGIESGTEEEEAEEDKDETVEEFPGEHWMKFVIGLKEALRELLNDADERINYNPVENDRTLSAFDEVFRDWLGRDYAEAVEKTNESEPEASGLVAAQEPAHLPANSLDGTALAAASLREDCPDYANKPVRLESLTYGLPADDAAATTSLQSEALVFTTGAALTADRKLARPDAGRHLLGEPTRSRPWLGPLVAGLLTCGAWQTWWREWRQNY